MQLLSFLLCTNGTQTSVVCVSVFLLSEIAILGDFKIVIILVIYKHMITREVVCIDLDDFLESP